MICSKCSVDKPENQYETYVHKPQGKWRTRKYCRSCFKEQKRLYNESIKTKKIMEPVSVIEEPVVIIPQQIEEVNSFSNNPDYKLCRTCQEYVHKDDYYRYKARGITYKEYLDCRKCCNKKEAAKRKNERKEWKENTGGSDRIRNDVGVFEDKFQKEQCYMVMKVLGYTYNEECGHFLKPGVKEYVDGKLFFPKLRSYGGQKINYNNKIWTDILEEFNTGNNTYKSLSRKYGYSPTTICNYINRMKNE